MSISRFMTSETLYIADMMRSYTEEASDSLERIYEKHLDAHRDNLSAFNLEVLQHSSTWTSRIVSLCRRGNSDKDRRSQQDKPIERSVNHLQSSKGLLRQPQGQKLVKLPVIDARKKGTMHAQRLESQQMPISSLSRNSLITGMKPRQEKLKLKQQSQKLQHTHALKNSLLIQKIKGEGEPNKMTLQGLSQIKGNAVQLIAESNQNSSFLNDYVVVDVPNEHNTEEQGEPSLQEVVLLPVRRRQTPPLIHPPSRRMPDIQKLPSKHANKHKRKPKD